MTLLTELFTMNDMNKLKYELVRLIELKDYKTVNTLYINLGLGIGYIHINRNITIQSPNCLDLLLE